MDSGNEGDRLVCLVCGRASTLPVDRPALNAAPEQLPRCWSIGHLPSGAWLAVQGALTQLRLSELEHRLSCPLPFRFAAGLCRLLMGDVPRPVLAGTTSVQTSLDPPPRTILGLLPHLPPWSPWIREALRVTDALCQAGAREWPEQKTAEEDHIRRLLEQYLRILPLVADIAALPSVGSVLVLAIDLRTNQRFPLPDSVLTTCGYHQLVLQRRLYLELHGGPAGDAPPAGLPDRLTEQLAQEHISVWCPQTEKRRAFVDRIAERGFTCRPFSELPPGPGHRAA